MSILSPPHNHLGSTDRLSCDDVHIWAASLHSTGVGWDCLWRLLGVAERAHADRFRLERNWRDYVAAHGVVRIILSLYCDTAPERIRFVYGPYGKPGLVGAQVQFNFSHADDHLLCAVTGRRQVGVDLERVRMEFECVQVAQHVFSAHELEAWKRCPARDQPAAFYRGWVRKEAYVKAVGLGLSFPVRDCEASVTPDHYFDGQWTWRMLAVSPGYVGALVMAGPKARLSYHHCGPDLDKGDPLSGDKSPFRIQPGY